MAVKFFGQFLVETGVVSREDLLKAIDLQEASNLKFGEIAALLGILSDEDIEKIHNAQRTDDLRFGDIALKLGLINREQMQEILTRQKNGHIYIGEALVKVGALGREELDQQLKAFQIDQAAYATGSISVPSGIAHPNLWEMAADLTCKLLGRVAEIAVHPSSGVICQKVEPADTIAAMAFAGSVGGRYLLAVSDTLRQRIACAVLNEKNVSAEPLEVLDDAVMEFVNIVCGNVAAKAAQLGKTMEIFPPAIFHPGSRGIEVPAGQSGLRFPFVEANGETLSLYFFLPA